MAAPPALRVRMLGGFSIELADGGSLGRFERPSAGRLLELLLLRPGRRAGREELADALFPRLAPARSANAISKALTMARAALEPAGVLVLEANRSTIWIREDADIALDLDGHVAGLRSALTEPDASRRIELLEAALSERGRLLDDELYADWAIEAREELGRLRATARLALARGRSAAHQPAGAHGSIEAWAEVAANDAASEEAAVELIRAYAASGQRDLAVRAYHRYRAAAAGLGLEPAETVGNVCASCLATAGRAPPAQVPASLPLVFGRQHELERLRGCLGRGAQVLVLGPPGPGSHCPPRLRHCANSPAAGPETWIRNPLRRPLVTWIACSSPRWTLCKTVCRATPSRLAASSSAT